ncbi:hypothetical protein [Pseudomonas sp. LS-2]|jgi:hypothetical protein|uniref:hypothetical protein n=1 Tax=Pseudomonas sp. LS-2 TaxID=2315859 RepID=UPI0015A89AB1|nr:hypothetical protein [Pseudomonas sp. LS-2]
MARARNIKPGFFSNELLVDLPAFDRLAFIGLWCLADREGRLEDRVKRIKIELFPCDDYDVNAGLSRLAAAGFITRYQVAGHSVIEIVNFQKHQSPHGSEKDSLLPDADGYLTVHERKKNVVVTGSNRKVLVSEREFNVNEPLEPVNPPFDNALIPDCGILNPDSLNQESKALGVSDETPADRDSDQPGNQESGDQSAKPAKAYSDEFEAFWREYPRRHRASPKPEAWKKWQARLKSGVSPHDLITAATNYRLEQESFGKLGTEFVKQPSTFLGAGEHWTPYVGTQPALKSQGPQASAVLSVPKHSQEMYPNDRF